MIRAFATCLALSAPVALAEPVRLGPERAAASRALAMPSRLREAFGLVAAEASGSGLPFIASDMALIAGEIEAGGTRLAVPRQ